jgi:DNA polymerase delta subunit 1
MNYCGEKN